jgi:large subunit ribosomal protein L30
MSENKTIKIKLIKSGIGRMKSHKLCIKGLGFKKIKPDCCSSRYSIK